jgi:hypothetical protein
MIEPFLDNSKEYAWVRSVVSAVSQTAGSPPHRWSGRFIYYLHNLPTPEEVSVDGRRDPLVLPLRLADAVVELARRTDTSRADSHRRAESIRARGTNVALLEEATWNLTAQVIRMTAPPYVLGRLAPSEHGFDVGLGDVWTEQRHAAVWKESDSAELAGQDSSPYVIG